MQKRLIILSRRFPYYKTEAFLETEIKYIAREFDDILIFPSETCDQIRETPSNVKVVDEFANYFQNKKSRILKAIFSKFLWESLYKYRFKIKTVSDLIFISRFSSSVLCYKTYFAKNQHLIKDGLVYTYWLNESTYALCLVKEKFNLKNINIISRAHRYDIYEGLDSTPSFWPYRNETLNMVNQVFSISSNGKDFLDKKYENLSKVSISRLGVFDNGILSSRSTKNLSIVSVSRIESFKRVDLIFKSIIAFSKANLNMKINWTHFGEGSKKDQLKDLITQENPAASNLNVKLMGAVLNEDIYEYYNHNDVDMFINLSSSEGIPVSIMEAQSYGIPVIATDVGGSGEIVQNNNGILLNKNPHVEEVVDAISKINQINFDPLEIKKIWKNRFDADKNYSHFAKSLKKIENA